MTVQTITLGLPEVVHRQLERQARVKARPIEEVALQVLTRNMPPLVEDDLPVSLRVELNAMRRLSDQSLWDIAAGTMNPDKVALYDVLLERLQDQTLTPEGREWLMRLREEADTLMLRKAHAYALLKSRGHTLPTLAELRPKNL